MSSDGTAEVTVGCNKAGVLNKQKHQQLLAAQWLRGKGNIAPFNDINICIVFGDVCVETTHYI